LVELLSQTDSKYLFQVICSVFLVEVWSHAFGFNEGYL
jgi:hypothetical protein